MRGFRVQARPHASFNIAATSGIYSWAYDIDNILEGTGNIPCNMSFFRTTRQVSIITPLPSDVSPSTLIEALHDHERMLRLSPIVTGWKKIHSRQELIAGGLHCADSVADTPEADLSIDAYHVQETVPYVGGISFTTSFKDVPNGLDSIVNAPLGVRLEVSWRVVSGPGDKAGEAANVLREECKLDGCAILMPFIKANFEKTHRTMQASLLDQLSTQNSSGSPPN